METKELTPEARAARAAYLREWRKRHPGKQSEYSCRYWARKAEQIQQQNQPDDHRATVHDEDQNG